MERGLRLESQSARDSQLSNNKILIKSPLALQHLVKGRIWFPAQLCARWSSNALRMRNVINAQKRTLLLHFPSADLTGGSFEIFLG